MSAVGVLGMGASTSGLIYAALGTSEPFWQWTTAVYFGSLALAIWALGIAASQMMQRRQFIGTARATGWSFAENTRLHHRIAPEELRRVQQLRSELYAIGAHRAAEDLRDCVAMVFEGPGGPQWQADKPYGIAEQP